MPPVGAPRRRVVRQSRSKRRKKMRISVSAIVLLFATANALVATAQTLKNSASTLSAQKDSVSTREMERINWMEFKEVVPSKIQTVLLPTGTLEPHGVINNGADITAPVAVARQIAPRVHELIAPVLPYGITGSMEAYPGAFQITESAYRPFVKQVMEGLARNGFRNIIVLNGHGGPEKGGLKHLAGRDALGAPHPPPINQRGCV